MIKKLEARLFNKKVGIPALLNKLNDHTLNLNSTIKIDALFLPFLFTNLPKTYTSSKAFITPINSLRKSENITHILGYLPTNIPVKYDCIELSDGKFLGMLYPINSDLKMKSIGVPDHYKCSIEEGNLAIPIKVDREDYYKFIGQKVTCYCKIQFMDDEIKERVNLSREDLIFDLTKAYSNPFEMNIRQIYLSGMILKYNQKNPKITAEISYCIEFQILNDISTEEIHNDIRNVLNQYQSNTYQVWIMNVPQNGGTGHVLWASNVYINIVNKYIGFYIDFNLSDAVLLLASYLPVTYSLKSLK